MPPGDALCLGRLELIPTGSSTSFQVGGRRVAVFHTAAGVFAAQATCPHAGADLTNGQTGPRSVICPAHGYRFDLESGACRSDPSCRLRTYRVWLEEGNIMIADPGSSNAPGS